MNGRLARIVGTVALGWLASACNGNINRACDFTYGEARLHIGSATDARTGASLGSVVIKSIRYRGAPLVDLRQLVDIAPLAKGVALDGQQIVCTIDCAFAVDEGQYEFVVTKPGYQDFPVSLDARYRNVDGDCERTLSGGVNVSVQLIPQ